MEAALSNFSLGTILLFSFVPFSIACLFFGTQGGYYNTDKYEGDGTAHKVLKWTYSYGAKKFFKKS